MNRQPQGANEPFHYSGQWTHELFDCSSDCKKTLCACLCAYCFINCTLLKQAEESFMTRCFCPQAGAILLRGKIRGHYKIEEDMCKELLCIGIFMPCALVQMSRELEAHGLTA